VTHYGEFHEMKGRDEIAEEFTNSKGEIDNMMAGLHEIRVRLLTR